MLLLCALHEFGFIVKSGDYRGRALVLPITTFQKTQKSGIEVSLFLSQKPAFQIMPQNFTLQQPFAFF